MLVLPFTELNMANENDQSDRVTFQIVTRSGDGRVESTESAYKNEKGKNVSHGPSIDYYDNGRKWTEVHYRNGKMHGKFCHWTSDGQPTVRGTYRDGKREGLWTEWHGTGKLRSQCRYSNGNIQGSKVWFGNDGKTVIREDRYDPMSHRLTEQVRWHENGKMAMHGTYKPRPPVDEAPLKKAVSEMKDPDNPTPEEIERLSRLLKQLGEQLVNIKEGACTYWDEEGKVLAKGIWKDDKPWGGICAVRPDSSRSVLPPKYFARFKDGKEIEKLPNLGEVFD